MRKAYKSTIVNYGAKIVTSHLFFQIFKQGEDLYLSQYRLLVVSLVLFEDNPDF